ncbi:MAG: glutamine synthetase [Candidatus Heimdallarchaeota archaeon]|nr:glutamine synthetase [Candidatus Heimdallarchaeota archaeon]
MSSLKSNLEKYEAIQVQFSDLHGVMKSVTVPIESMKENPEEGIWFDGSSIEGFTRIYESDLYLRPDFNTLVELPWMQPIACVWADVYTPQNKPFLGDPRDVLKRTCARAKELGFELKIGAELEFFLLEKKNGEYVPIDHAGYFDSSPFDQGFNVKRDILSGAKKMGIPCEMGHHEVARGQQEIDFRYSNALETADRIMMMKLLIQTVAKQHGLVATFMPKPFFGQNGSGMHCHQSLWTLDGENAFHNSDDSMLLSDIAKQFVAGQLKYAKEIIGILAPTVNSYKRLVPGYEAPCYISWAQLNRSALIRIPRIPKDRKSSVRAELRCPDPMCNPYLAMAVMLEAGLEGIKQKLEAPTPRQENLYKLGKEDLVNLNVDYLPSSLWEATQFIRSSGLVKQVFDNPLYDSYIRAKMKEWDEYRLQVTVWEKNQYLMRY